MRTLHPVLRLFVEQPQLAAEHVSAYAALFAQDGAAELAHWQRRVMLQLAVVACLGVALTLAGVGAMLWAVLPTDSMAPHWPLWVLPLVPALAAAGAAFASRGGSSAPAFMASRQQLLSDVAWLRESRADAEAA
jgi:cytochrome bd-type quinol oxidase subunit 2